MKKTIILIIAVITFILSSCDDGIGKPISDPEKRGPVNAYISGEGDNTKWAQYNLDDSFVMTAMDPVFEKYSAYLYKCVWDKPFQDARQSLTRHFIVRGDTVLPIEVSNYKTFENDFDSDGEKELVIYSGSASETGSVVSSFYVVEKKEGTMFRVSYGIQIVPEEKQENKGFAVAISTENPAENFVTSGKLVYREENGVKSIAVAAGRDGVELPPAAE